MKISIEINKATTLHIETYKIIERDLFEPIYDGKKLNYKIYSFYYIVKLKDKLVAVHGTDELSKMYDSTVSIGSFHNLSGIFNACKGTTWNQEFNKIIKGINK